MIEKLRAAIRLLRTSGPERDVPKKWLFRTSSTFDRRFKAAQRGSVIDAGEYWQIEIDGQLFLWPRQAAPEKLLQILSEILTPGHPHHYLYGHTKIGPNDVVLDIGACEGAFSAVVTTQCSHVIAVEPSHLMCSLIESLFELRNQPAPEVIQCLLGSEQGKAYYVENEANPGGSHISARPVDGAYEVPVRTLDELAESLKLKPTFIKCDAEGAEPAIFSGGKSFLRKCRPKLAITTYHNPGDYAAMYSLLTGLGYNVEGKGFLYSAGVLRVQMIHAW